MGMTEGDHQTAIVTAAITTTAEIDTSVIVEGTLAPDLQETIEDVTVTLVEVKVQSNLERMTKGLVAEVSRKIGEEEEEIHQEVEVLIMLKTIGRDQAQKSRVRKEMMKIASRLMSHRVVITLNNVKQKSPILRAIAMAAVAR